MSGNSSSFLYFLRYSLLLAASAVVTACSIPTPGPQQQQSDVSPALVKQHQQRLDSINRWQLSARMAIIQKLNNERDSLYLDWLWQPAQTPLQRLRFSHPLKGQVAQLTINRQLARLDYDGQQYTDASAERLLSRLLEVKIPVAALSDWVLGKTRSELSNKRYLSDGRLSAAEVTTRSGQLWQINWYYQQHPLPSQIHLESNQLTLKLQLNEWQTWPALDAQQ